MFTDLTPRHVSMVRTLQRTISSGTGECLSEFGFIRGIYCTTVCSSSCFWWLGKVVLRDCGFSSYLHSFFFNSFGAKFQTTFFVCFYCFNKLSLGKTFICKVDRLNVKQRRSR